MLTRCSSSGVQLLRCRAFESIGKPARKQKGGARVAAARCMRQRGDQARIAIEITRRGTTLPRVCQPMRFCPERAEIDFLCILAQAHGRTREVGGIVRPTGRTL